jgi:quinol monooxygenase YgiN/uncharacterized protein YunC (DUF1805 family)
MQTIIASFIAKKGCEEKLLTELQQLLAQTAREPGAIFYELHRGEPGTRSFHFYERYADEAAMKTHVGSPYLQAALKTLPVLLAQPPVITNGDFIAGLQPRRVEIDGKLVTVHTIPLGPANLVFVQTARGILACGAIDPAALQRFGLPTARVKPTRGTSIANLDDLLAGEVREANEAASALGVKVGLTGRQALALF